MYLILFNIICWVITFFCIYLILNPNLRIFKKIHKSPYKAIIESDLTNSYNVMEILKSKKLDQILENYKSFTNNFNVIAFNFNGGLNVGSIMRTASVYGCDKYYIIGRKIYDTRSCVGSNKFLDLHLIKDIVTGLPDKNDKPKFNFDKFKKFIIKNKLAPIFIEQGGNNINEFNFKQHLNTTLDFTPTFIFGNETFGIDNKLINICRNIPGFTILTIPQIGLLKSLNVSNSASIIFWEYYRQILYKEDITEKYNLIYS